MTCYIPENLQHKVDVEKIGISYIPENIYPMGVEKNGISYIRKGFSSDDESDDESYNERLGRELRMHFDPNNRMSSSIRFPTEDEFFCMTFSWFFSKNNIVITFAKNGNYHIAFVIDDLKMTLKKYKEDRKSFELQPLANEIIEKLCRKSNLLSVFANNMELIQPIEDFSN
jgi:hypothetical protein